MANPINYSNYITSPEWRGKHAAWLKTSGNRCAMFPWVRVGQVRGDYHKYNMHHLHYQNLGREKLGWDVLPLCDFAHDQIIHGLLSGWKRPSKQKRYPNGPQRIAHAICRMPIILRIGVLMLFAAAALASLKHLI